MSELLIKNLKRNNRKAQATLYENYSKLLYLLIVRYINDNDVAKTIVNQSFYLIFTKIDKFTYQDKSKFEAWMKKISVNEALIYLRSNKKLIFMEDHAIPEPESSIKTDKNLISDDFFNLVRELPEGYRIIFNLYAIEGYSHKEIAEKLNIKESTSRSQLSHARAMLKTKIEQHF